MSKPPRANLKSFIGDMADVVTPVSAPKAEPAPVAAPVAPVAEVVQLEQPAPPKTSIRKGKPAPLKERAKQLSLYLEEPVYEQLRDLAYTERKKIHGLVLEGLDLLFKKRGAKTIDSLARAGQGK